MIAESIELAGTEVETEMKISRFLRNIQCDTTPWTHPFRCAVTSCKNVFNKYEPNALIKYHNFPLNLELQRVWLRKCNLQGDLPTDTAKVCSVHFLPTDYETTTENSYQRTLKPIAFPTQFLEGDLQKEEIRTVIDENLLLKQMHNDIAEENDALARTLSCLERQRLLKEKKLKILKRQSEQLSKCNILSEEKSLLSKVFSQSQINVLLHKKRVVWSNDDMAMSFTLRQMGNRDCYLYLKNSLNFPLPSLSSIQRWAASK